MPFLFMENESKREPWWKPAITVFGQVSGWVVVPLLLALMLGKYLDGRLGTKPWLFLGLTCVGFAVSSFGIVRVTVAYMREIKKDDGKYTEPKY